MIKVTRLNGKQLYINAELIRTLEGTPDTVISLTDGTRSLPLKDRKSLFSGLLIINVRFGRTAIVQRD